MTKNKLTILCVTLLSVFAVACGEAGTDLEDKDPGAGGQGGDGGVGGVEVDPLDLIAPFDNDSAANPSMDELLRITGDRELVYSDLISAEEGDREDFVQFELPNNSNASQNIKVAIDCIVEGDTEVFARVEILNVDTNGDSEAATGGPIDCNDGFSDITIQNDQVQAVRIYMQGVPETQTLIEYTLTVAPFF
ncbi:MAG: hypothetical protein HKN10_04605 [Myxococcales bacterium]|nr:hypothetical protein [Myxococcales bacterium]